MRQWSVAACLKPEEEEEETEPYIETPIEE
jgi:hypothetical protein